MMPAAADFETFKVPPAKEVSATFPSSQVKSHAVLANAI